MTRLARKLSADERRVMLPLLLLSIVAAAVYLLIRDWRMPSKPRMPWLFRSCCNNLPM